MLVCGFDNYAIEWNGGIYPGLGQYEQSHCYRWDGLIQAAHDNNIYVQPVIINHGAVSSYTNAEWSSSPYYVGMADLASIQKNFSVIPRPSVT